MAERVWPLESVLDPCDYRVSSPPAFQPLDPLWLRLVRLRTLGTKKKDSLKFSKILIEQIHSSSLKFSLSISIKKKSIQIRIHETNSFVTYHWILHHKLSRMWCLDLMRTFVGWGVGCGNLLAQMRKMSGDGLPWRTSGSDDPGYNLLESFEIRCSHYEGPNKQHHVNIEM